MKNDYLGLLGIARKAGKVELGEEAITSFAERRKIRLLLTASDSAERTKNTARRLAELSKAPCIEVEQTREELGNALGTRPCAAVGVSDMGIAAALVKKLSAYNAEAEKMLSAVTEKAERFERRKKKKRTN